mgnify:CR=1 FL=1
MRNLYYVAIEGPIAVGKTSLAKLLSERLGARLILEGFGENPFLTDFYEEPERYPVLLQRQNRGGDLRPPAPAGCAWGLRLAGGRERPGVYFRPGGDDLGDQKRS